MKEITSARYIYNDFNFIITYSGFGFDGRMDIYTEVLLLCRSSHLKKILKMFEAPLDAEYKPFVWSMYHCAEDLSKTVGAAGAQAAKNLLTNLNILAKELGIK